MSDILRKASAFLEKVRHTTATSPVTYRRGDRAVYVTPASLSASQNDYAPGTCDILRLSSSTAVDITGLLSPSVDGAMRLIINVNSSGGAAITLRHESTSSAAANRFRNATGGDFVLPADGGSAVLTYSTAISRWRIL